MDTVYTPGRAEQHFPAGGSNSPIAGALVWEVVQGRDVACCQEATFTEEAGDGLCKHLQQKGWWILSKVLEGEALKEEPETSVWQSNSK